MFKIGFLLITCAILASAHHYHHHHLPEKETQWIPSYEQPIDDNPAVPPTPIVPPPEPKKQLPLPVPVPIPAPAPVPVVVISKPKHEIISEPKKNEKSHKDYNYHEEHSLEDYKKEEVPSHINLKCQAKIEELPTSKDVHHHYEAVPTPDILDPREISN